MHNAQLKIVPRHIHGIHLDKKVPSRVNKNINITIHTGVDHFLLPQAFKLRYDMFCKKSHIFNGNIFSQSESDAYDTHAMHMFFVIENSLASYIRLIVPPHNYPFEEFTCFPSDYIRSDCVEASRAVISPRWHLTNMHKIMFEEMFIYCKESGHRTIVMFLRYSMFNLLKRYVDITLLQANINGHRPNDCLASVRIY